MSINLDIKGKKLLYELDCNSRQPASVLAKKVGLSKAAILYRMQQLEKEGVIEGYKTYIDLGKLGYVTLRLMINLHNVSPEKEKEILEYLNEQGIVKSLSFMEGEYNILMNLTTKRMEDFDAFWHNFREKYLNYFDERSMSVLLGQKYFTRAYLVGSEKNRKVFEQITSPKIKPHDLTDIKILNVLSSNSRVPLIEIAKQVGITVKTAIKRIKNLLSSGIIVRHGVLIDNSKINIQRFRVHGILMRMNENKQKEFTQFCMEHPNIVLEEDSMGGDDFEMEIQVKGLPELREIITEFKARFADILHDYKVFHILKVYKDDTPKLG